jgi:subtilisin family serine protease
MSGDEEPLYDEIDPAVKISPAFRPFLVKSASGEKREAIVIFKAPLPPEGPRVRGRLRTLKQRLDTIKARSTSQQAAVQESYQKESKKHLSRNDQLEVTTIGKNTLPVASIEVTRETIHQLAANPNVLAILPNQKVHLIKPKQIELAKLGGQEKRDKLTWGLKQLEIPKLWRHTKGADMKVAVLDTGVHGDHSALAGRVKDFVVVDPLGRRIKANSTFDSDSHGTHVCGTIAGGKTSDGVSIGVAPEATLYVGAVILGSATLKAVMEGISWAIEKGVDIISMSLGFDYYDPRFNIVLKMLIEVYGILPVAAIGNNYYGNTSSPGSSYHALSVGAVEKVLRGNVEVTDFSSGGSLDFPGQEPSHVIKPDIVAPGSQIYSCIPPQAEPDRMYEYAYFNGTSMATPHVAGVAALLMAAKPSAPVPVIVQALRETAKHPQGEKLRPDNRWGYGLIQPVEALKVL